MSYNCCPAPPAPNRSNNFGWVASDSWAFSTESQLASVERRLDADAIVRNGPKLATGALYSLNLNAPFQIGHAVADANASGSGSGSGSGDDACVSDGHTSFTTVLETLQRLPCTHGYMGVLGDISGTCGRKQLVVIYLNDGSDPSASANRSDDSESCEVACSTCQCCVLGVYDQFTKSLQTQYATAILSGTSTSLCWRSTTSSCVAGMGGGSDPGFLFNAGITATLLDGCDPGYVEAATLLVKCLVNLNQTDLKQFANIVQAVTLWQSYTTPLINFSNYCPPPACVVPYSYEEQCCSVQPCGPALGRSCYGGGC
jgi:hypothetical protein